MEKRFVGIGEVAKVTLVDEHGFKRQAKITPVDATGTEKDNCYCCILDCENACFDFDCCPADRADGLSVVFVEVDDATDA